MAFLHWLLLWAAFGLASEPDSALETRIRERLARSQAAADGFQVRVSRGVVTIAGSTRSIRNKAAATRIARSAGAQRVVNQVQVSPAARSRSTQSLSRSRRTGR